LNYFNILMLKINNKKHNSNIFLIKNTYKKNTIHLITKLKLTGYKLLDAIWVVNTGQAN